MHNACCVRLSERRLAPTRVPAVHARTAPVAASPPTTIQLELTPDWHPKTHMMPVHAPAAPVSGNG